MKVIIVKDAQKGSEVAFNMIKNQLLSGELHVLGLATGSTPLKLYNLMTKSDLDFSNIIGINLDEYKGLSKDHDQSYAYFMKENLFSKKPFKETHVPNGLAENAEIECKRYDEIIKNNPVDIQILGIGTNGHIGFNEPGTSFDSHTSEVELTESTIEDNKRFFESKDLVPTKAFTKGIRSIMNAKNIVLLAFGEAKANAIFNTVEGPVSEQAPASVLQTHSNATVICDEAAAKLLNKESAEYIYM